MCDVAQHTDLLSVQVLGRDIDLVGGTDLLILDTIVQTAAPELENLLRAHTLINGK